MALTFVSVALLSGCGSAVDELNFTRKQPALTNVIGTWVPTSKTLTDMRKYGGYTISVHELVLSSDGRFFLTNMPDWWTNGFGDSHKGFESGGGNWKVEKTPGAFEHWAVDLSFTNALGQVTRVGPSPDLSRQKPPYLLYMNVGDPDQGRAMFFERKNDLPVATNRSR